jgi:PAS domain S-box-containing protein
MISPDEKQELEMLRAHVAELELREVEHSTAEARLGHLLDIAADAIIAIDADQRIVLFNKGAEKIFDYTTREVIGQPLEILIPQQYVKAHNSHVRAFAAAPETARLKDERAPMMGRRKDGTEFPAEASIAKLVENGQTTFTVILRDITARQQMEEALRKSEAQFRRIFDYSNDAIFVLDSMHGDIMDVNPRACAMLGYSREELLSMQLSDIHPHELPRVHAFTASVTEQGIGWTDELTCLTKSGDYLPAEISASIIKSEGKHLVISMMRDITARKEMERRKDAFVSNVSHELRTPITSLKLYHGLLKKYLSRGSSPEKLDNQLEVFKHDIDRMEHIVEDLLRLSQLDQGQVTLNMSSIDLNTLARQHVEDRTVLAQSQGLSLIAQTQLELPRVQADEGLIGQVLSILLTNALTYTPSGGHIVIQTHAEPSESIDGEQWIGFSVRDTGPGIPPEEHQQLFQRFERGTVGHESGYPGTGLGLSIAKEIVERHGGWIEVISEGVPGKGTTFSVWLSVNGKT